MNCPKEDCPGTLQRYPMNLLMSPVIKQYQCRYCNKKYKQVDEDGSTLENNDGRDYDWAFICDLYEKQIDKLNKMIDKDVNSDDKVEMKR